TAAVRSDGLRFFALTDLGVVVTLDGQLTVSDIRQDCPLAKAGLKVRDEIVAIDGNAVTDAEMTRQHLRRAFVLGGTELSVRRDGKPLTLRVSFFNWRLPPVEPAKETERK